MGDDIDDIIVVAMVVVVVDIDADSNMAYNVWRRGCIKEIDGVDICCCDAWM